MGLRHCIAAVLVVLSASFVAADDTPPTVTPNVSGTLGSNGWYVSDVAISWTIVDDESTVFATTGCEADVLTQDDTARTYTCVATSEGGTTIVSQTIGRDTTGPVVSYSDNRGTYELGDEVRIFCDAFDPTSGLASTTCTDIVGPAFNFSPGINVFTATAIDNAGNVSTGSVSLEVRVSYAGLSTLVDRFVPKASLARQLKRDLEGAAAAEAAGNLAAELRHKESFIRTVTRESGKNISPTDAATLLRLVAGL